jgi:hypothetical protein
MMYTSAFTSFKSKFSGIARSIVCSSESAS